MDERVFKNTKNGKLEWVSEGMYYRFQPNELPISFELSPEIDRQMLKTALALGNLKGRSADLSKKEIILLQYPFMIKEAQLSSEIEGTRSTIGDVFRGKKIEETNIEKKLDNEEILNYLRSSEYGMKYKEINEELIKKIHKILLKGVRGSDKNPGEYKTKQNAIGDRMDTPDSAKFVPASPETTPLLMKNLINYINSYPDNPLYKIAIVHYQFEAIHPFRDGNGRLGRLLIMWQLCKEDILDAPLIYISEYFNRNRDTYIETLFEVSSNNNINDWILFFLKALEYQAKESLKLITELQTYKKKLHSQMHDLSKSPNMPGLINSLFKEPFITINDIVLLLEISQPAAWNLVEKLKKLGILTQYKTSGRKKIYVAKKIINIIEGKK